MINSTFTQLAVIGLGIILAMPSWAGTVVSIEGDDFLINGHPTYEGRVWQGHRIEGLLLNNRLVQATFDDTNPQTAARWVYADTGKWDADRNNREFVAMMPEWRHHGLLSFTVNFQGGSPEGYSGSQPWENNPFNEDGSLRSAYTERMKRILDEADRLGMVPIVGFFYFGQSGRFKTDENAIKAADALTKCLLDGGWRNVLVEVNNEANPSYKPAILRSDRVHELILRVRDAKATDGHRLLVGTSFSGSTLPTTNVVAVSDFILIHGNGVENPARIGEMVRQTRLLPFYRKMPILFNEDDHEGFEKPMNNLVAAVSEHASWGWFDWRRKGEDFAEGYQSVPVNWGTSSERKRAFYAKVAEITGSDPAAGTGNSGAWQTISNEPPCTARDETALTALDGKLYLIGGRGIQPVEEYDPSANGWKQLAPPPLELHHFQALGVDGRVLIFGAMTGNYPKETPVANLWWFDPKKNEWTKGVEIPEGRWRGGAGAVLSGDQLYLVCGITNGHWNGFVPWMDKLDLKTGRWTVLPDAPHARDHFNAVLVDGKIVAADGRTSYGEKNQVFNLLVPEVDVFDIATGQWSTLPNNLPTPRAGGMVAARDGKVIVIGGESVKQTVAHNEVEALTLATGQWETLPPLNLGSHGTGAAFLGDTLYVVSGVGNRGGGPLLTAMQKLRWPVVKKTD